MRNRFRRAFLAIACVVIFALSDRASAQVALDAGVNFGALKIATNGGRVSLVPTVGVRYRGDGWLLSIRNDAVVVGAFGRDSWGINNVLTALVGRSSSTLSGSIGASASAYWFGDLCGPTRCGPVMGVAPGIGGHVDYYWKRVGPFELGAQIDAHLIWHGGRSLVLPGGASVMGMLGPTFRYAQKRR